MGFDVSFHPLDVKLIENQIVPVILGKQAPEELYRRAAKAAKNRFLANAWGLGLLQFRNEQLRLQREASNKGVIARLLGRSKPSESAAIAEFDSDLYVWGRPYFITSIDDDALFESIDRYTDAAPQDADELARRMIADRWPDVSDRVRKDDSSGLPSDEDFLHSVSWKIELLREAVKAVSDGTTIRLPDGEEQDPVELLSNDAQMAILEFHSALVPGWMGRGLVAPTQLLQQAGRQSKVIERSDKPFASLSDAISALTLRSDASVIENFMVGGYVAAENVAVFLGELESTKPDILSAADGEGWRLECEVVFRKIAEALKDARRRGIGFVEASEIYSAPMGVMN